MVNRTLESKEMTTLRQDMEAVNAAFSSLFFEVLKSVAPILRFLFPGYGTCFSCRLPWAVVKGHDTPYDSVRGVFPLCERCWSSMSVEEREPYYRMLIARWRSQGVTVGPDKEAAIMAAVRKGL